MRRTKLAIPFFIGLLMVGMFVNLSSIGIFREFGVFMAWATATPTATATATATAVTATPASTPSPGTSTISGVTSFGYLSTVKKTNGVYGGYVIFQTATAALLYGQVVIPDSSNANAVVVAGTNSPTNPMGVVVGCTGASATQPISGQYIGCNPAAAQGAIVQVGGIAPVVCDRAIATGTVVMPSPNIAGMVTPYSAGTVDEEIGVLTTGCAVNGTAAMLLYK